MSTVAEGLFIITDESKPSGGYDMDDSGRKLIRVAVGLLKREAVFFCPQQVECTKGAMVILSRSYGTDWGTILGLVEDTGQEITESALRVATIEDHCAIEDTASTDEDIADYNAYVAECGLSMKLVGIDHGFDKSKVTFYFVADGRVDFRELVKKLNRKYQRRVELYQLNLEEQFKMFPTCGICGFETCCNKIKGIFGVKVSSRVCKDQKLVFNPLKMSGCCGKARCCYMYEHVNYAEYAEKLPRIGGRIDYRGHEWKLADWDVFRRAVLLYHPEYGRDYVVPWDEFKVYFGEHSIEPLNLLALFGNTGGYRDRNGAGASGGNGGRKPSEVLSGVSERYEAAVYSDEVVGSCDAGSETDRDSLNTRFGRTTTEQPSNETTEVAPPSHDLESPPKNRDTERATSNHIRAGHKVRHVERKHDEQANKFHDSASKPVDGLAHRNVNEKTDTGADSSGGSKRPQAEDHPPDGSPASTERDRSAKHSKENPRIKRHSRSFSQSRGRSKRR